jgi:plasmid stabilization system protein ParE
LKSFTLNLQSEEEKRLSAGMYLPLMVLTYCKEYGRALQLNEMKFRFHQAALEEYEESALYYVAISPLVARRFVDEIEAAIRQMRQHPKACAVIEDDIRRRLVKRFPFGIYYCLEEDHILIVAVMHLSRIPGYWKDRI